MILSQTPPTASEVASLRALTGWGAVREDQLQTSLDASPHVICARDPAGDLIGIVRVVGDGVMYLYIQDLIVHPDARGQGIARALMTRIMDEIRENAAPNLTVGLMAVAGLEAFYAEFGFATRPDGRYGAGMTMFL